MRPKQFGWNLAFGILIMLGFAVRTVSVESSSVSGKLHYPENFLLPADAIVTISLTDVSPLQDSDATIIDRQVISADQHPGSFELTYDPAEISDRHLYAIQARVTSSGRVILTNASAYPVITQGNPTTVEVCVKPRDQ